MRRVKLVGLLAVGALLVAMTAPRAGTLPPGNRSPGLANGTYGFNFNGGVTTDTSSRASGSGTITFDGEGDVTGGIIHCDKGANEQNSAITGGSYSLNNDGSGYVTINTATSGPNSDPVCAEANPSPQYGVDLFIAVTGSGKKIHFATDGSSNFYTTGKYIPFNGEMDALYP